MCFVTVTTTEAVPSSYHPVCPANTDPITMSRILSPWRFSTDEVMCNCWFLQAVLVGQWEGEWKDEKGVQGFRQKGTRLLGKRQGWCNWSLVTGYVKASFYKAAELEERILQSHSERRELRS